MTKNAIAIATDYNYKHYLKVILTTLKKVECKVDIFVRLVDFTKEQIEEMKLLYDVNFIIDNPNMSNKKTIFKTKDRVDIEYIYKVKNIKDIKKILYSPRSFYTCHSRFKSIKELLEQGYDNILTLDCDTVVLKNFDEVFNFKEDICTVQNIEMNKVNGSFKRQEIIDEHSSDLADTAKEKFDSLVEGVEYSSEEDFATKVKTIKESYFEQKAEKSVDNTDIDDVAVGGETSNEDLSNAMAAYTNAISKTKDIKISS